MKLDYDPGKDAANVAKHGIALADAMLVYEAPNKITLQTSRNDENRLMDVAWVASADMVLVLVYVVRGNVVRAISLRRASTIERRMYEKTQQN
ncbi:MAG: BrnT family toxin [Pigmentiphaga sp.]|nr:BrnT family toxin [Pigmentiphaga sp.]